MKELGPRAQAVVDAPGVSRDLCAAAAVRETFQPDELLLEWLQAQPNATPEMREEAFRTTLELEAAGLESTDVHGKQALRLAGSTRLKLLKGIGQEAALRAAQSSPPERRTVTERALAALLAEESPPIDHNDRVQLSAFETATRWAQAAGARTSKSPEDLARSRGRAEFLESMGGADLHRFVGRTDVLEELEQHWRARGRDFTCVLIEGPGGMGKSLTICRFISDILEADSVEERPLAVFHIDFDRPSFWQARAATLLVELVKQTRRWCEASRIEHLVALEYEASTALGGVNLRSDDQRQNEVVVQRLIEVLGPAAKTRGVVLFVDTFEQVDGHHPVAAGSPQAVAHLLAAHGARVFMLYASRAFSQPEKLSEFPSIRLGQLTVPASKTYLLNEASRAGVVINDRIAHLVQRSVGRSPLALRLSVALLAKAGFEPAKWPQLAKDSPESVQATLYERVLERIRDPQLRKLAAPGLLVRRLSAEVIERVLAEPCGLNLKAIPATVLMELARREGQLFTVDPQNSGVLWHRPDVRATMLANLERMTDPKLAHAINENAVAYYEGRGNELASRTEELYHRLRLDQPADVLRKRWTREAGLALKGAQSEFPPAARSIMSAMNRKPVLEAAIGSGPPKHLVLEDPLVDDFQLRARELLESNGPLEPIVERWKEDGERLGVPLGNVYAEVLFRTGMHQQLLKAGRQLLTDSRAKAAPHELSGALTTVAALLEGRAELTDAQTFWTHAVRVARVDEAAEARLAALVGSARIRRKLGTGSTPRADELHQTMGLLLPRLSWVRSGRWVLARELGAELGEFLWTLVLPPPAILDLLNSIGEMNELFPSATQRNDRAEELGRRLFNRASSTRELSYGFIKLLTSHEADRRRAIETLRNEVDWSLAEAVRRYARP